MLCVKLVSPACRIGRLDYVLCTGLCRILLYPRISAYFLSLSVCLYGCAETAPEHIYGASLEALSQNGVFITARPAS